MTDALNYLKKRFRIAALAGVFAAVCASSVVAQENATTTDAKEASAQKNPAKVERSAKRSDAVRTLQDINIEGEIAVPQVLFITSRDNRRYRDGLGSTFRVSALDVARSIDRPTRLRLVARPGISKEE